MTIEKGAQQLKDELLAKGSRKAGDLKVIPIKPVTDIQTQHTDIQTQHIRKDNEITKSIGSRTEAERVIKSTVDEDCRNDVKVQMDKQETGTSGKQEKEKSRNEEVLAQKQRVRHKGLTKEITLERRMERMIARKQWKEAGKWKLDARRKEIQDMMNDWPDEGAWARNAWRMDVEANWLLWRSNEPGCRRQNLMCQLGMDPIRGNSWSARDRLVHSQIDGLTNN